MRRHILLRLDQADADLLQRALAIWPCTQSYALRQAVRAWCAQVLAGQPMVVPPAEQTGLPARRQRASRRKGVQ